MFAIIADIIHSRSYKDRAGVQEKLAATLAEVNQRFQASLASAFSITLGDEFQGLLIKADRILEILDVIRMRMDPVDLRFGIGTGEINTRIEPSMSIGADGPAYWNAREAIQRVHQENHYGTLRTYLVSNQPSPYLASINYTLALTDFISSSWRGTQKEVLKAMLNEGWYTDKFDHGYLAAKLGILPSSLTRRLKSSGIKLYLRSRMEAQNIINQLEEQA